MIRACIIWFALVGPDNLPSNLINSTVFGDDSEPTHSCFLSFVEFELCSCAYILEKKIFKKRQQIDDEGLSLCQKPANCAVLLCHSGTCIQLKKNAPPGLSLLCG